MVSMVPNPWLRVGESKSDAYKQGEPADWDGVQTLKAMYRSEIEVSVLKRSIKNIYTWASKGILVYPCLRHLQPFVFYIKSLSPEQQQRKSLNIKLDSSKSHRER